MEIASLPIEEILVGKYQIRENIDEDSEDFLCLVDSIRQSGIIEPLIVDKNYNLIVGHRRLAAAKQAGIKKLPVCVSDKTESENMAMAIVENIQRKNLNLIEMAKALLGLKRRYNDDIGKIAKIIGASPAFVVQRLRLLELPKTIQEMFRDYSQLTLQHGLCLLRLSKEEDQVSYANLVISDSLTAKQLRARTNHLTVGRLGWNQAHEKTIKKIEELMGEITVFLDQTQIAEKISTLIAEIETKTTGKEPNVNVKEVTKNIILLLKELGHINLSELKKEQTLILRMSKLTENMIKTLELLQED